MVKYLVDIKTEIYLFISYILIGYFSYIIINHLINQLINNESKLAPGRKKRLNTLRSVFKNIIKYLIALVVILNILRLFNVGTGAILAGLGIIGLVIGWPLQDLIRDFLSGLFIIFDNKYDVGDVVSINNFQGEVIFLGLKSTRIKNINGEVKIILNRNITEVINYSINNTRAMIDITISNHQDSLPAEKEIITIINELSNKIKDTVGAITMLGVNHVDKQAITYRIMVETKPLKTPNVQRELLRQLSLALTKRKVPFLALTGVDL